MSLAEQIQRVDGGQNDTLKAILTALGVTVNGQKIDQLSALAAQISPKLKPENLASESTLTSYGLSSGSTVNDVLAKLSKAALVGEGGNFYLPSGDKIPNIAITIGQYVGTGLSGSSNPNSISVGFDLNAVFIYPADGNSGVFSPYSFVKGQSKVITMIYTNGSGYNNLTWNDKSVSWYSSEPGGYASAEQVQLNNVGRTYIYIALGVK